MTETTPHADLAALAEAREAFGARDAADHGVPAVLRSPGGEPHLQGTLVRIPAAGSYYLHLDVAEDGRVLAALTEQMWLPDEMWQS